MMKLMCFKQDFLCLILQVPLIPGLILGLHPAKEQCRYKVTVSLIGWAQA